MAGKGDARSSAELAVKHNRWSKVCGQARLPASAATSGGASVSTARVACPLSASEAVTGVTGYSSSTPLFFGRRVIDVQSPNHRPSTTVGAPNGHSTHLPASTMYVSVMIGA